MPDAPYNKGAYSDELSIPPWSSGVGAVEYVTLNRPDVRNAFNEHVIADLTAWARARADQEACCASCLAGAGKVFSAGADAAWMSKMAGYSREENVATPRAGAQMFRRSTRCRRS